MDIFHILVFAFKFIFWSLALMAVTNAAYTY